MAKITITDLSTLVGAVNDVNNKFQQIEDELNNKVLYRDNPVGEDNSLQSDIDLNNNDILNANTIQTQSLTIGGIATGTLAFQGNYYISSSQPSALVEGDLWYDTVNDKLGYYDGSAVVFWVDTVTDATTQATAAAASASAAASSASAASTSASNAATSATNAASSASAASSSASSASTSATNAATSATSAATSATSASNSASTATTKASEASTSATNAASSASAAATSATAASGSATNAASSASAASTSATAAAGSASSASTSASNAATSETNAGNSATAAAASAVSAASSAANAALAYDSFDDRYLGSKATDPTTDNDGDPLVTGALYFNSTSGVMRIYDGSTWIEASSATVGTMNKYRFTATAGQTVFTGTDDGGSTLAITPGVEIVTLNGIVLEATTDYTPSAGTITLASGAALNDELNVYAFGNFTVADTVSKSSGGTFGAAIAVTGNVTATAYYGDGSNLTGIDALPTQTGHSGEYLTTDGSTASWTAVSANSTTLGLYEHANTIAANYTITTNNNAMSAGPITINSGVSVTVPTGSTWTIV